MDLRAVIMAGGTGTRFWPLSRCRLPKQFLPITGEGSMIAETAGRLHPLLEPAQIYTIADRQHSRLIRSHLPDIPESNLLVEPQARNTAPCLMLATALILEKNPEAVMAVLPADHAIGDAEKFRSRLKAGAEAAVSEQALITFGIPPSYPATGYGYIRFSREDSKLFKDSRFSRVREFKEKPDVETAKKFCRSGEFFWNSGMFLWQAKVFAGQLEQFAPELFPLWQDLRRAVDKGDQSRIQKIYVQLPATSIDYALMEKSRSVWMGEGDFGWSDVGAWSALSEFWPQDSSGNTLQGPGIALDSQDCLVFNPGKFTALVGVENLIVVDSEDALLICRKDLDQNVKELVTMLKKQKREDLL